VRTLPPDLDHLTVSCDGASRGNPGPAGIGVSIVADDGSVVDEIARGIGETTNNVAEYTAVIEGLTRAKELGARTVTLRSDSLLLIRQLTGRYRVKTPHLVPLHRRAERIAATFDPIGFQHVPRELNQEADRLANEGVDRWLAGERWEAP
jgi:ribonuclease HI